MEPTRACNSIPPLVCFMFHTCVNSILTVLHLDPSFISHDTPTSLGIGFSQIRQSGSYQSPVITYRVPEMCCRIALRTRQLHKNNIFIIETKPEVSLLVLSSSFSKLHNKELLEYPTLVRFNPQKVMISLLNLNLHLKPVMIPCTKIDQLLQSDHLIFFISTNSHKPLN